MACNKDTLMLIISAYVDNEVTPEESARAEAHLQGCAEFCKLVEEWRGQLSVFKWAYTSDIHEECNIEELKQLAQNETPVTTALKAIKLPAFKVKLPGLPRLSWRPMWTKAAALTASAAVIMFIVYHIATRPIALEIGQVIATSGNSQAVSIGRDVFIRIGPGSKISRIDANSVRLDQGWVDISVRRGKGLCVLTKRLKVVDQGTEFNVMTGPELDYVKVSEGSVTVTKGNSEYKVNAGQVLAAQDKGVPSLAELPREYTGSMEVGKPLGDRDYTFVPRTEKDVLWEEGLRGLSSRFPDARLMSRSISGTVVLDSVGRDIRGNASLSSDSRMINEVYTHSAEIAKVAAGERIDSRGWAIPVGVVMVSGEFSTHPVASDSVFYVQLVPRDGTIVWRLSAPDGSDFNMPMVMEKPQSPGLQSDSGQESLGFDHLGGKDGTHTVFLWLADWPGELKPMLKLTCRVTKPSKSETDMKEMRDKLDRAVAGLKEFDPDHFELLYLAPDLDHRFLMTWNREARAQLCRVTDLAKQGQGGSAILAAIVTDTPLDIPGVGPGVYLVKFVQSDPARNPNLELTIPGAHVSGSSGNLPILTPGEGSAGERWMHFPTNPVTFKNMIRPEYAEVFPRFERFGADRTGFPIRFSIIGRPDGNIRHDKDGGISIPMDDIWAEGWIRIRKP